jgi:hypothetical protein
MIIKQKSVTSFNNGNEPLYNPHWNKAQGFHTLTEHTIMRVYQWSDSGMRRLKITLKGLLEWIEWNKDMVNDIIEKYSKYEV